VTFSLLFLSNLISRFELSVALQKLGFCKMKKELRHIGGVGLVLVTPHFTGGSEVKKMCQKSVTNYLNGLFLSKWVKG